MDVLAHASMKDAAKCDTHCELQILVNHQISERIWRRWDFPAARLFQCLLILSNIISPQIPDDEEGCCCCIIYNPQCCSSSFICVLVWWFRLRVANGDIFCVVLSLSLWYFLTAIKIEFRYPFVHERDTVVLKTHWCISRNLWMVHHTFIVWWGVGDYLDGYFVRNLF